MKRKNTMLPMLGGDAMVRAESVNEEDRTFEVVWTTGARVRRRRWLGEDYDEELEVSEKAIRLDRLNGGAPFLDSHDSWSLRSVLGAIVPGTAKIEKGQGVATVRFSDAEEDESTWRKIKSGVIRNVSVGYRVHKYEIDKREGQIELRRAVDWEPMEVSAVPIGADPKSQIRSDDSRSNECLLEYRQDATAENPATHERKDDMVKNTNDDAGAKDGAAKIETRADPSAAQTQTIDTEAVRKEGAAAERQRNAVIDDLAKRNNFDADLVKRWKEGDMTVDKIREEALDAMAKRADDQSGHSEISEARVLTDADDKFMRGAENAILARSGQAGMMIKAAEARGEKAPKIEPGEFRGMSLVDLARYHLELRGERSGRLSAEEVFKRSLLQRGASAGYGAQGTGDFAVLLENTLHKVLLGAYAVTADTWSRFCKVGSVSDFRAHNRYRLGSFGSLDSLNEHGEFKNKTIPDGEKYSITAATKGNIIGLSRQAFIDDDLGAFSDLATMFGRAAKLTIEKDVYALLAQNSNLGPTLADSKAMFHADHGNIAATGAISVAVFDDIAVKMGSQKDITDEEVLDIKPSILLVPLGSRGEAVVINGSEYDPDTSGKLQRPNKVRGQFADIVGTARLTGTRVYAFADPAIAPAIEVAFLNGQSEPFLDSDEGWRVDGMEWKVRLDYGVAGQDYRGAVTAAGQ